MGRPTVWLPCGDQISAHFPVEECPFSSMDSIQLKHILSVVSQVIGKGGEEHQVVKNRNNRPTTFLVLDVMI